MQEIRRVFKQLKLNGTKSGKDDEREVKVIDNDPRYRLCTKWQMHTLCAAASSSQ